MPVQTCKWESFKTAGCADTFGQGLATRWFGLSEQAIEARAGRFVRGKNKGKLRGWVVWLKCREGGWVYSLQTVIRPGMIFAAFVDKYENLSDYGSISLDRLFQKLSRVDTAYGHKPGDTRPGMTREPVPVVPQAPSPDAGESLWTPEQTRTTAESVIQTQGSENAMKWIDGVMAGVQQGTRDHATFLALREAIQSLTLANV